VEDIHPLITDQEILCAEEPAGPSGIVVFGASGDLTRRKLLGSLARLYQRELLDERFYVLGCGRKAMTDEQFRHEARRALGQMDEPLPDETVKRFCERLSYVSGDYAEADLYENLKQRVCDLDRQKGVGGHVVYYLAVPPFLYPTIIERLGRMGPACPAGPQLRERTKLVIEKPFGRDLDSATELNRRTSQFFDESQIYRIDHYLGKETVQNLMMFRFANSLFEPVWNRNHIDHVQIAIAEKLGIEHRGSYYDSSGALRDMFQNHMLQMLSLVAMEPPISFEADRVRDETVKLLRSVRPIKATEVDRFVVRGQYGPGTVDRQAACGYREEDGVGPASRTETYVAAKFLVDNWRWRDVPFYMRTGKRMARKNTEIAITFRKVPHSMFNSVGLDNLPANVLVFRIQPEEGMSLAFEAKRPGSKVCMSTLKMSFDYRDIFGVAMPESYERLLLDCLVGDQTLFTRFDAVEQSWRLVMPILEAWSQDTRMPWEYPAGASGFAAADRLIAADQRRWRELKRG